MPSPLRRSSTCGGGRGGGKGEVSRFFQGLIFWRSAETDCPYGAIGDDDTGPSVRSWNRSVGVGVTGERARTTARAGRVCATRLVTAAESTAFLGTETLATVALATGYEGG